MSEERRTPVNERANQSQIRRAQRGVVAGYIHGLSERHENGHAPRLEARLSEESREGG
jgi:hypothetical protein